MRQIILAAAAASLLSLTGCNLATLTNGISIATSAAVPAPTALVAANSFDALEATATNYLKLPTCGTGPVLCKTPAAVTAIVKAVRSGRSARNAIEALLSANNNAAIPIVRFNTLTAAIATLESTYSQYGISTNGGTVASASK